MRSNKPSPRWAPGLNPFGVNLEAHRVHALVITVNFPSYWALLLANSSISWLFSFESGWHFEQSGRHFS